jgi:hypothetical protein
MKVLKWIAIIVGVLLLLYYFIGMPYLREQTKKHSPEKTATYSQDGYDLSVNYSSPFKKGRVIFGDLIPYNAVWRTGANEPTTFTTATDITIKDRELAAGTYSLWTEPKPESWTVMFNEEVPAWGVTLISRGRKTSRDPDLDVLQVEVPVTSLPQPEESFTIDFEKEGTQLYLSLFWDTTKVQVPINP